jgi:biopolymer transport protein ExbD
VKFQRRNKRSARVDIVPMIDVIFFLLIFFMLFARFETTGTGIPVDLPKAATASAQSSKEIMITITKHLQMYFNETMVSRNELEAYIADALKDNPSRPVIIKADKEVQYENIIMVMDMVGKAGGFRLSLAADRPQR